MKVGRKWLGVFALIGISLITLFAWLCHKVSEDPLYRLRPNITGAVTQKTHQFVKPFNDVLVESFEVQHLTLEQVKARLQILPKVYGWKVVENSVDEFALMSPDKQQWLYVEYAVDTDGSIEGRYFKVVEPSAD